ncbi:MAG: hypothetical protein E3J21_25575 [Anaerolineales bacterium]|nr:MAG: hypothetical protein E3J21_25575 [Anaerolineales bacterium]
MALRPGYYLLEKRQLGQAIPRPRETMSIIAFLRAVQRKEPLPDKVCVLGLERLLYHAADNRRAARVIQQALYNPQAKRHLHRQGPVVILLLEYLELSTYWKAGIRRGGTSHEVFHIEWVFPRADIETVGKVDVCYSMW